MKASEADIDKFLSQSDEQHRAMFEFYKANPDLAAIDLLNQDLAAYQRKIVKGNLSHQIVINVLSRGMGKTRMMGVIAALEAMFNPKKKIGFLGAAFRVSKLAFAEFEAIYRDSDYLQACVKRISRQNDVYFAEFHNGAFIYALPLAADSKVSIRGIRLHTSLIDEYPHVPKEVLDAVITPMLATQRNPMLNVRRIEQEKKLILSGKLKKEDVQKLEANKVLAFSSAYFRYNHMWESIEQYRQFAIDEKRKTGKTKYAVYIFNYKDAPEGFFDQSIIDHAKDTTPELIFRMEYLSEFPVDSEGFFKRSLLDSCISRAPDAFYLEEKAKGSGIYFMGIDPARNDDAFAISIMKLVGNEMRLVRTIAYNKLPLPIVANKIRELVKEYKIILIGMDAGGGGLAMKDLLGDPMTATVPEDILLDVDDEETVSRRGSRILRMVNFSSSWIAAANYEMKASFEHKRLMLPNMQVADAFIKPDKDEDDVSDNMISDYFETINQIVSIELTMTKGGILHFDTHNQRTKKDLYTSVLIVHKILADYIKTGFRPKELATGGWLGQGGNLITGEEDKDIVDDWKLTTIIDKINDAKKSGRPGRFDDAGLG